MVSSQPAAPVEIREEAEGGSSRVRAVRRGGARGAVGVPHCETAQPSSFVSPVSHYRELRYRCVGVNWGQRGLRSGSAEGSNVFGRLALPDL